MTPQYEPGDAVVEDIGEFTLRDGRKVMGVVLTFPAGPPDLPLSVVWTEEPLILARKAATPLAGAFQVYGSPQEPKPEP